MPRSSTLPRQIEFLGQKTCPARLSDKSCSGNAQALLGSYEGMAGSVATALLAIHEVRLLPTSQGQRAGMEFPGGLMLQPVT